MTIPVFFINLDSRPDRRDFMERQLLSLGVEATRIAAVMPDDIPPTERAAYCNPDNWHWMTEAELACNFSHMKAWRVFLASDATHALILEDDAELSGSLPAFIEAASERADLPPVLRIEATYCKVRLALADYMIGPGVEVHRPLDRHSCAAGYVISREAATFLLDAPEMRQDLIDNVMFDPFNEVAACIGLRCCVPALCQQVGMPSDLLAQRSLHHATDARRPWLKWRRKIASWISYDAKVVVSRIREHGIGHVIPFKP